MDFKFQYLSKIFGFSVVLRRVDPEPIGRIRNFWASSAPISDSRSETVYDLFTAAATNRFLNSDIRQFNRSRP